MNNKITPVSGLTNFIIGILAYKFITDLILYINGNPINCEIIQKKFIYEFLFGLSIITLIYLFKKYNFEWINEIKYGLYLSSIILLFESVFINWNHLSSDTKLILTGLILMTIIGFTITNTK